MKVVHLVTEDSGGAGRAARRISKAERQLGIESRVLVLDKLTEDPQVEEVYSSSIKKMLFKTLRKYKQKKIYNINDFYVSEFGIEKSELRKLVKSADIIHIHWINHSFLSLKSISKLSEEVPVVWTMHDMWPFTAGCYYDSECGGYRYDCESCNMNQGIQTDMVHNYFLEKEKLISKKNITFVGCSKWISQCASASKITMDNHICTIPNPIDVNLFFNSDKAEARKRLGIETDKKIILYGALSSNSSKRKGYEYLRNAIDMLDPEKYCVLIFGNSEDYKTNELGIEAYALGEIKDDFKLADIYNAADVFVAPSKQENLSNAVMESLSCGTPVVAFQIGGMSDMIANHVTGYLAQPFESGDLAKGIIECADNKSYGANARNYVQDKFSEKIVGNMYIQLYNEILDKGVINE